MTRLATAVVLPKVVVAETLSVRVSRKGWPEGRLIPPLALVTPAPLIVPPVQVSRPLTVTVEVPVNVPPEKVSADVVTAPPTLLKFAVPPLMVRSEEHTSELQSLAYLVCRLLLEKKKKNKSCYSGYNIHASGSRRSHA